MPCFYSNATSNILIVKSGNIKYHCVYPNYMKLKSNQTGKNGLLSCSSQLSNFSQKQTAVSRTKIFMYLFQSSNSHIFLNCFLWGEDSI